jgi:hypothetical protein
MVILVVSALAVLVVLAVAQSQTRKCGSLTALHYKLAHCSTKVPLARQRRSAC